MGPENTRRGGCRGLEAGGYNRRVHYSRRFALGLLSIPGSFFIFWCAGCSRPEAQAGAKAASSGGALPVVAVAKVTRETLSKAITLTGEFRAYQEIDVMAKVSGYVSRITVDVGDRVSQGQLLATLEVPEMANDLARAKATLKRDDAEIQRAMDEIRRMESTHQIAHLSYLRLAQAAKAQPGLIAQQEIDDAQNRDLASEAQVQSGQSALAVASQQTGVNQADQGRTETMLAYARVTAPFSGVVIKRYANLGSLIQAGTASQTQAMPVIRLSDQAVLRLILPVPESAASSVKNGQPVGVRVPSLKRAFPGKVARFAQTVQPSTRTMETEVDVANPGLTLIPGMYAEVDLDLDRRDSVVTAPVTAVDFEAQRALVVRPNGAIESRTVKLGLETDTRVEILSGLSEGELVVIGSRAGLEAGHRVKPKMSDLAPGKGAK